MKLSQADVHSALWTKINDYLEAELAELRVRNDYPQSEIATASTRGEILAVKRFLALGQPEPEEVVTNDDF